MAYDKALIAGKLRRWELYIKNFRLPEWDEIPEIGLYMEQVLSLLKQYLDYLPPELKEEQFITASTINNYVRTKVMPEPIKKRYYRTHIAYLIVILTLKQNLSMAMIKQLLPTDLSQEELRTTYTNYVHRHRITADYFVEQIRMIAGPILGHPDREDISTDTAKSLIVTSAMIGGLTRLLSEKLILLDGKTVDECDISLKNDI